MSMSVGKEIRLPFLDYRLVNWLAPMPVVNKLRDGLDEVGIPTGNGATVAGGNCVAERQEILRCPAGALVENQTIKEISCLLEGEWVSESLGLIDKTKFRLRYNAYVKQRAKQGLIGAKDIFPPIALELWARRFGMYLCSYFTLMILWPSLV